MKRTVFVLFSISLFFLVACASSPGGGQGSGGGAGQGSGSGGSTGAGQSSSGSKTGVMAVNVSAADKAQAARDAAILAGADKLGEAFRIAEDKYNAALAAAGRGDARSELEDVAARYNALENYALALAAKDRIDRENLASASRADYDNGERAMDGLGAMFSDPDSSSGELLSRATTALESYMRVLNIAYRQRAVEARTEAIAAKRRADGVMAGVAAKEDYDTCVRGMTSGDSNFSRQNFMAAYDYYVAAINGFGTLYANVSELRAQALAAMEAARRSVSASEKYAIQADVENPIVEESQEGIENPNAVLVEPETYADPSHAVFDIPETIE